MNLKKNWGSKIFLSLRVGHNVLKQFLIIAIHFHNIFIHHTLTRTTRITYSEEKLQSCLKLRNFQNPFDTQNAEARFYPPNRCLGFDFKFKKFSIKQAIFIKDIYTSPVKAHTHKTKFKGFLRFLLLLARFVHLKFLKMASWSQ